LLPLRRTSPGSTGAICTASPAGSRHARSVDGREPEKEPADLDDAARALRRALAQAGDRALLIDDRWDRPTRNERGLLPRAE